MKNVRRNVLVGFTAAVMITSIGLALSNKFEQRKAEKEENITSKQRADNVYYDSLTEKDIAWG
tara:strand:- start:6428 stop:6616 length:189 start_codon:yes stop_codon:yes gene_type:complete